MQTESPIRLADLAKVIPASCYENPTSRGLAALARDSALYVAALVLLAYSDSAVLTLVGWVVAANAISALFVLGHDAAHGSLFKSSRLNYIVGQLAMLPSLHAFSVWAYGHNRIHHAFSCCRDLDFVWRPISPQEFEGFSALRKLRHRVEWSALGSGLYYARAMWFGKIVQGAPPRRLRRQFRRDRATVLTFAVAFASGCAYIGWSSSMSVAAAAWTVTEIFVVPWLLWNTMIGWSVYIQHIHPDVAWRTRRDWRKLQGLIEGSTNYRMPKWINTIWHNIFDHTAHHLDPRIPFYNLPAATAALQLELGDLTVYEPYRVSRYLEITRRCKLFDFEAGHWVDYSLLPAARRR